MNVIVEKIGQVLFPERLRPYVSFRSMTAFVALLALWNIGVSILMKGQMSRLIRTESWLPQQYSPYFFLFYNIGVGVGLWAIYATRKRTEYYQLRVFCYTMLLGGLVGELLDRLLY
jgi:lipoprotein signal peptidase